MKIVQRCRAGVWAAGLLAVLSGVEASTVLAQAPTIFDETRTIGEASRPVQRDLVITTGGRYRLTVTDLETPAKLSSYRIAVTRDGAVVSTAASGATPATSIDFDATIGTYVVHIVGSLGQDALGQPASAATVGARVVNLSSNAVALDFVDSLQSVTPPVSTRREVETTFTINAAGRYELALTDQQFPTTLGSIGAAVVAEGGQTLLASLSAPGVAAFDVTTVPATIRLIAFGVANTTTPAGLLSVRVRAVSGGALVFSQNLPIGGTQRINTATLETASYTLQLTDLAAPAALATARALVIANAAVAAQVPAPGSGAFNAVAGQHELFSYAAPAAGSSGAYAVEIRRGTTSVISGVKTLSPPQNGASFAFSANVQVAGAHSLVLTDFRFPQGFTTLRAIVVQGSASLGSIGPGAAPLNLNLQLGPVTVLVFGELNVGANGLLGLTLAPSAAGSRPLLEVTQGAGSAFDARRIEIANAGRYQATVSDLAFPANFANLDVQLSRGSEAVGSFAAGGSFIFSAPSPGTYFLNFLARPSSASGGYGTYRVRVATAAPVPTVTLTADPASVVSGAATRLRWSSNDATSCTATGGWSGSKATSGEESTTPLTATATFGLECAGPGGRGTATVNVSVTPSQSGGGGGGGQLPLHVLLLLGSLVAWQFRSRRSMLASGQRS